MSWNGKCLHCGWPHHAADGRSCRNCQREWDQVWKTEAPAAQAADGQVMVSAAKERDLLVGELADIAEWEDRSYLYAMLHVRSLIRNLQADVAAKKYTIATQSRELLAISDAIGTSYYMDPPDGGDVALSEQVRRMRADVDKLLAAEAEIVRLHGLFQQSGAALLDLIRLLGLQTPTGLITALHEALPRR